MSNNKLCINCAHHYTTSYFVTSHRCYRGEREINLVTGGEKYISYDCLDERGNPYDINHDYCGINGKYYKPKNNQKMEDDIDQIFNVED